MPGWRRRVSVPSPPVETPALPWRGPGLRGSPLRAACYPPGPTARAGPTPTDHPRMTGGSGLSSAGRLAQHELRRVHVLLGVEPDVVGRRALDAEAVRAVACGEQGGGQLDVHVAERGLADGRDGIDAHRRLVVPGQGLLRPC